MACQGTKSELVGAVTSGIKGEVYEVCCALTGTIGSEVLERQITVSPSPQSYGGD